MPASKAINTGDSSSIYWPWPLQKLSVCITMDFDEHTMERRRGGVGFKGWSTDCSGLDAEEEECNLCASISSGWWALRAVFNLHFCESDPRTPPCKLASKIDQQ